MSLDTFINLSCSLVVNLVLHKSATKEYISQLLLELGTGKNIWTSSSILQMLKKKVSSFNPELSIRLLEEINKWLIHITLKMWNHYSVSKNKLPLFIELGTLAPLWNLIWISCCDIMQPSFGMSACLHVIWRLCPLLISLQKLM